jgi:hypothetical protein
MRRPLIQRIVRLVPALFLTTLLCSNISVPAAEFALPPGTPEFVTFIKQYPLKPIQDYTFLGTELSREKPIVFWDGRIEHWFDPAEQISWINEAVKKGTFQVSLVDGYLPAINLDYQKPDSNEGCEMTAFAADARTEGSIYIYVRLVEISPGKKSVTRCFRLPESAPTDEAAFEAALKKLRQHWTEFFRRGLQLPRGEPQLLNAGKASLARSLITFTGTHPHYGVRAYGQSIHDGFPPTIIALTHALLDWGQTGKAQDYLASYFDDFVTKTGRFDYYGPSLAEYGQMLQLVRRLDDI